MIPLAVLAELAPLLGELIRLATELAGEEPFAPHLIVDARCPHAIALGVHVNLTLVAVQPVGRQLGRFAVAPDRARFGEKIAAKLHAGIQPLVHREIQFEVEVAVSFHRAEKAVAGVCHGFTDDAAVLHKVFCLAAVLLPAGEVFPVEQINGLLSDANLRQRERRQSQSDQTFHAHKENQTWLRETNSPA